MIEPSKPSFRLKDLFVFQGFKFSKSVLDEYEHIVVKLRRTRKTGICPKCGRRCREVKDKIERMVRDLDIMSNRCYVEFVHLHIVCKCGYKGIERLDFVEPYSRHTKRFEEKVVILCRTMTIKDAANEMRIGWEVAKNIDKKEAKKYMAILSEISPKRIGMDEIAYQKGHKYLTVVRDVDLAKVIWVGKDRKKETVDKFFQELGKEKCEKIELAVMDMHEPFIASVKENTKAEIVFDKFHVAKHVNEALDNVRKQEFANAGHEEKTFMKKKRFLVLRRRKNLDEDKKESLKQMMKKNDTLYKAYLVKEQVLDIMDEKDERTAKRRIKRWIKNVAKSNLPQFAAVVKMIERYSYGIFNYFKYKITNAASEGFNTKINVIKRRAYGFRDLEYFMFKILQLCGIYERKD